jgi:HEAT repeat protein
MVQGSCRQHPVRARGLSGAVGLSRTKLADRLRKERDPEVLGGYVDHPAWQVRFEAIQSLGESNSPAAERHLLQVLANSHDKADLSSANAALGRVGSHAAIPALAGLIHHPVEDVKCSAIHALGLLGDGSLTPLYLDALSDRSWVAKWYAIGAIHRNGDQRAVGPVIDRMHAVLSRDRKTAVGGWTEVMYGLDFLGRWQTTNPSAAQTIEWVRSNRMDRLHPTEREWFETTFAR